MTTTREAALEAALQYCADAPVSGWTIAQAIAKRALSTPATEPQGYATPDYWEQPEDNLQANRQRAEALSARPAPQPAADTRVDLINRMDAVQACQVGPSDEWAKATKDGYNQAATDCAFNILKIKPDIIGTATPAPSDKIARGGGMSDLIDAHDAAYDKARGCSVYAPKQGVDPSEALYHATRSGSTSAACSTEWMRLYSEMKAAGLKSTRHPHLFSEATP